jgi:phage terminase small subunit
VVVKLTAKQRDALEACAPRRQTFVLEYAALGFANATEAARRAEYKSPEQEGSRLLGFADVAAAVEALKAPTQDRKYRSVEQLREYWDAKMETAEDKDALKASELLAKSVGALVEKREISGPGGAPLVIQIAPATIEAAASRKKDGE